MLVSIADRRKNLLTFLLLGAGLVILCSTWLSSRKLPQTLPDHEVRESIKDLNIVENFTFQTGKPSLPQKGLLALFVLNAKVCPPCLNEATEYAVLLDEIKAKPINILQLGLLFERDRYRAERFVRISNLPISVGYGHNPDWAMALGQNAEGLLLQQLVFVSLPEETLFYRVTLQNTITDVDSKRAVLMRMLATLRGMSSLNT